jgi:hypothetical protein
VPARETSVPHGTTIVAWTLGSRLLSAAHGVPTLRAPDLRNKRQTAQILTSHRDLRCWEEWIVALVSSLVG